MTHILRKHHEVIRKIALRALAGGSGRRSPVKPTGDNPLEPLGWRAAPDRNLCLRHVANEANGWVLLQGPYLLGKVFVNRPAPDTSIGAEK